MNSYVSESTFLWHMRQGGAFEETTGEVFEITPGTIYFLQEQSYSLY